MSMPALTAAQRKRLAEIVGGAASGGGRRSPGSGSGEKKETCAALTRSGDRCKNAPLEGSDRCRLHQVKPRPATEVLED